MARWREPREKSSPYITPEGEQALKTELKELWLLRRREVVPALSAAAAEGDAEGDGKGAKFLEGLDDLLDSPNFWRHVQSKSPQVSAIQILGF